MAFRRNGSVLTSVSGTKWKDANLRTATSNGTPSGMPSDWPRDWSWSLRLYCSHTVTEIMLEKKKTLLKKNTFVYSRSKHIHPLLVIEHLCSTVITSRDKHIQTTCLTLSDLILPTCTTDSSLMRHMGWDTCFGWNACDKGASLKIHYFI